MSAISCRGSGRRRDKQREGECTRSGAYDGTDPLRRAWQRDGGDRQQPRRKRDPPECDRQEELALHRSPEGGTAFRDHLHDGGELPPARDRPDGLPHRRDAKAGGPGSGRANRRAAAETVEGGEAGGVKGGVPSRSLTVHCATLRGLRSLPLRLPKFGSRATSTLTHYQPSPTTA